MWRALVLLLGLLSTPGSAQAYLEEGVGGREPQLDNLQGSLEDIVDELALLREAQLRAGQEPSYDQEIPIQIQDQAQEYSDELPIQNLGELLAQVPQQEAQTAPEEKIVAKAPQKKGQFEFVEFVEPHAKALKNIELLDKRAPVAHLQQQSGVFSLFGNSSNAVFIAVITMCCVASVVGVVGGAYYYNAVRKQRAEMFDDFTRYSPAGPGRDILRKGRGFAGSPVAECGDESLAYKAQLHHYQQTKQKIIGDEEGAVRDDRSEKSDDEADDLEEHNFSVYECPGLAPTGDIEVQNPNFGQQP